MKPHGRAIKTVWAVASIIFVTVLTIYETRENGVNGLIAGLCIGIFISMLADMISTIAVTTMSWLLSIISHSGK